MKRSWSAFFNGKMRRLLLNIFDLCCFAGINAFYYWLCTVADGSPRYNDKAYIVDSILLLIGIDLLFSMDHYDRFFMILGIEIIAAMLIGWLVYFLIDRKKQREAAFGSDPSEEV